MMNKYFNIVSKQRRIEEKIKKYYNAISDLKIKNLIDEMGYNEATLKTIESALLPYIKSVPGSCSREKWHNLVSGIKRAENMLDNPVKSNENDIKDDIIEDKQENIVDKDVEIE